MPFKYYLEKLLAQRFLSPAVLRHVLSLERFYRVRLIVQIIVEVALNQLRHDTVLLEARDKDVLRADSLQRFAQVFCELAQVVGLFRFLCSAIKSLSCALTNSR